jgi:hypothetical protein
MESGDGRKGKVCMGKGERNVVKFSYSMTYDLHPAGEKLFQRPLAGRLKRKVPGELGHEWGKLFPAPWSFQDELSHKLLTPADQ